MFFTFAFDLLRQPWNQSGFFLLITLLIVPFLKWKTANAPWNVAGLSYIGFIVVNSIFLWFTESTWMYFFTSLAISLAYVLVAGTLVQFLIRLLKIEGPGESAMIFLTIIYHPVALLMVILLKWIVRFV